jgi:hypothetical protein
MNFIDTTSGTRDDLALSAYAVDAGYLRSRFEFFATKYAEEFNHWSKFYAAYTRKELSYDNLDYEEWAFLCEQMLYEQTESSPPAGCIDSDERPDIDSGLSYWRIRLVRPRRLFRQS